MDPSKESTASGASEPDLAADAGVWPAPGGLLPGITAVVLTMNGERLLDKCLASLRFCRKILAVDSGSSDRTEEISRNHGASFVYNAWRGFAAQFTFAQTLVNTEWFLVLDQDEICPPALAELIQKTVSSDSAGCSELNGFYLGRVSWYFDRFMRHSGAYPDFIPRLFRTGFVEFSQDAHIHYHVQGKTSRLSAPDAEIIHYPYESFAHQWAKLNTYAQQGADHMLAGGKKGGIWKGIGHSLGRFLRHYVLKRGFLDGRAGFLYAMHGAMYAFSKYIRGLESDWGRPFDYERQIGRPGGAQSKDKGRDRDS